MSAVTFNYLITGMPERQGENAMEMRLRRVKERIELDAVLVLLPCEEDCQVVSQTAGVTGWIET